MATKIRKIYESVDVYYIFYLPVSIFFRTFALLKEQYELMKQHVSIVLLAAVALMLAACSGKKKSNDIITERIEKVEPKAPVEMQEYTDERDVEWIGKQYHIAIHRQPSDSASMVKDEYGQKYVDNVFTMAVSRQDGSVFFSRTLTKSALAKYLDDDYRKTGVFEGLVFDCVDGDCLVFAASVGHPQSDEYIPLVLRLSRMGDLSIKRDTQMDTPAPTQDENDEDGV